MIPNNSITYNKIFYVINERYPEIDPMLAIKPDFSFDRGDFKISWQNTGRGFESSYKEITNITNLGQTVIDREHPPKEIKVTLLNDSILTLRVLTCDVYYNQMISLFKIQQFKSDEELQDFYKNYEPGFG